MIRRRRRGDPAAEADAVAADLDRIGALVSAGATQVSLAAEAAGRSTSVA